MSIVTKADFKEFMKRVDEASSWSDIEPEEYESACEYAGINYYDYSDPDALYDDLCKAL